MKEIVDVLHRQLTQVVGQLRGLIKAVLGRHRSLKGHAGVIFDCDVACKILIPHPAIMAAAAKDARLKKRTLTNLYNERPTWLKLAHETLDRAALAAYVASIPRASGAKTGRRCGSTPARGRSCRRIIRNRVSAPKSIRRFSRISCG